MSHQKLTSQVLGFESRPSILPGPTWDVMAIFHMELSEKAEIHICFKMGPHASPPYDLLIRCRWSAWAMPLLPQSPSRALVLVRCRSTPWASQARILEVLLARPLLLVHTTTRPSTSPSTTGCPFFWIAKPWDWDCSSTIPGLRSLPLVVLQSQDCSS